MVDLSQGICNHIKAQKVHVKEQMEFVSNSTTVLPYGSSKVLNEAIQARSQGEAELTLPA